MQTLQTLALIEYTVGGVEAYIAKFKDAIKNIEEVEEYYSANLRMMTFLSGIIDDSYRPLHDILMEKDSK